MHRQKVQSRCKWQLGVAGFGQKIGVHHVRISPNVQSHEIPCRLLQVLVTWQVIFADGNPGAIVVVNTGW